MLYHCERVAHLKRSPIYQSFAKVVSIRSLFLETSVTNMHLKKIFSSSGEPGRSTLCHLGPLPAKTRVPARQRDKFKAF